MTIDRDLIIPRQIPFADTTESESEGTSAIFDIPYDEVRNDILSGDNDIKTNPTDTYRKYLIPMGKIFVKLNKLDDVAYQAAFASNALTNDNGGTSQTSWNRFGYVETSAQVDFAIELMSPKATAFTTFANQNGRSGYGYQTAGGTFNATTAADSITFFPASGNITGSYSVYGYNK